MSGIARHTRLWAMALMLTGAWVSALAAGPATPSPATPDPPAWGEARAGLQIALDVKAQPQWGGEIHVNLVMQNVGQTAVELPDALGQPDKAFLWLLVQQGSGAEAKRYFSQRITLGNDVLAWPKQLARHKKVGVLDRNCGGMKLFAYERGVEFLDAYKAGLAPDIQSVGPANETLQLGPVAVLACLYMEGADRPVLLKSKLATFELQSPRLKTLSASQRTQFLADLLTQFDRSAWSAKTASTASVKLGPAGLPALIEAVNKTSRPPYSRMWLATTIAKIQDPQAVEALTRLLADKNNGVATVVAYHGSRQNSQKLNAAICARAETLKDPNFTAYALLGFIAFGKQAPQALLAMGLDSDVPRTRAMAAAAMGKLAGDAPLATLTALLKDPEPRVRAQAARVLGYFRGNMPPATIEALIDALALEGEVARVRICEALGYLSGQRRPYDPDASAEANEATLTFWRDWWRGAKPANK